MSKDPAVNTEETSSSDLSLASLEEKYREQMRQIFPAKIDLPWATLKTQIEMQIDLHPDFQRRDRWNNEKRSRFIESVVMNVPVPPVFLGEEKLGKYAVLDGRQRLTAAYKFLCNDLRLEGLHVWTELNGLTYAEIVKRGFGATIDRRFLPAILLTHESSLEVKYEVFDRLNTGGVVAEPMEVRNAIYRGEFNSLLHELSAEPDFRKLWGMPGSDDEVALERNALFQRMDDLELVLRFFALRTATLDGMRFKDRLSEVMKSMNEAFGRDSSLKERERKRYLQAMRNCLMVFGEDAFKPDKNSKKKANRSAPYADAVMYALAGRKTSALTPEVVARVRIAFQKLTRQNEEFRAAIEKGTNGESAIKTRMTLARAAVDLALESDQPSGGKVWRVRVVSRRK